jgi:ribosomal protein L24E
MKPPRLRRAAQAMISLICEHCKETLSQGTGRWVADNGNVSFYCGDCESKLLLAAIKGEKPRVARRAPKAAQPGPEVVART